MIFFGCSSTPSAVRCMYYTHSQKVPSYVGRHLNTRPKVTQQHIAFCESLLCPCCILHSTNADVEHFENLALHKVHSANTKYILWPWSFKPVINITEWDHRFFSVIFFLVIYNLKLSHIINFLPVIISKFLMITDKTLIMWLNYRL